MMNSESKKIVILETGGSHDEILHPQIRFLSDKGVEVHLIIGEGHLARITPPEETDFIIALTEEKTWLDRWRNLVRIRNYLLSKNIRFLVINTCQGAFIRDLSFLLPRKINITGISHNPQKLNHSFNQKLINRRVKKYLVLSDNILDNVQALNPGLSLQSFYPVFYPTVLSTKKTDSFLITIPGAVDLERRDYYHLLNELKIKPLNKNVKFIFLGRCKSEAAKEFKSRSVSMAQNIDFEFFENFIPEKKFLEITAGSQIILPLITPNLKNFELYRDYKISGGINLALGFKIPLLLEESLKNNPDYQKAAFFYRKTRLVDTINELSENENQIREKKRMIINEPKFSYSFQKENYISFISKST